VSFYRPEFERALYVFAAVSASVERYGFKPPVLVGGAAVELYSASQIATGDLDVVIARQDRFEQALAEHGFVRPSGAGQFTGEWVHPDLGLGFQVVGDRLLGGLADISRVLLITIGAEGTIAVIAVEDLIADRMGQYASGAAPEMLTQARTLFSLYHDADLIYMERRIREETSGTYGLADLQAGS